MSLHSDIIFISLHNLHSFFKSQATYQQDLTVMFA